MAVCNRHRGEISATLDGRDYRLCLTLGALAELEGAFGVSDMMALAVRFENGRLGATDAVRIIGAGLRGAGHDVADVAVAQMRTEGGAAGFVSIVVELLAATFGGRDAEVDGVGMENVPADNIDAASKEANRSSVPFPGTT